MDNEQRQMLMKHIINAHNSIVQCAMDCIGDDKQRVKYLELCNADNAENIAALKARIADDLRKSTLHSV